MKSHIASHDLETGLADYRHQLKNKAHKKIALSHADTLAALQALTNQYLQQEHKKHYGIFASWFNPQRTQRRNTFLTDFQNKLTDEVQVLSEKLTVLLYPYSVYLNKPAADKIFPRTALYHTMIVSNALFKINSHTVNPLPTLTLLTKNAPLLHQHVLVQRWGNDVVIVPHDAPLTLSTRRRWPNWLFRSHNACHDFIRKHSSTLAYTATNHDILSAKTLIRTDAAIAETLAAYTQLTPTLNTQARATLDTFVRPLQSRQISILNQKFADGELLLDELMGTLMQHYPLTQTQLAHQSIAFSRSLEQFKQCHSSIVRDLEKGVMSDNALSQGYEQKLGHWRLASQYQHRCLKPCALKNKVTFLSALTQDLTYLSLHPTGRPFKTLLSFTKALLNDNQDMGRLGKTSFVDATTLLFKNAPSDTVTQSTFLTSIGQWMDNNVPLCSQTFNQLVLHFPEPANARRREVEQALDDALNSTTLDFLSRALALISKQMGDNDVYNHPEYESLLQRLTQRLDMSEQVPIDKTILAFAQDEQASSLALKSLSYLPDSPSISALRHRVTQACEYDIQQLCNEHLATPLEGLVVYDGLDELPDEYFEMCADPQERVFEFTPLQFNALWEACRTAHLTHIETLCNSLSCTEQMEQHADAYQKVIHFIQSPTLPDAHALADSLQAIKTTSFRAVV